MKKTSKFLSIFLALIMVVSLIPITSIEAEAANGIQTKIDLIKTLYNTGSYFTSDGKSHYMWDYSVCPEDPSNSPMPYRTCKCSLSQQTKKTTGLYSGAEVASKLGVSRWQCAAFATYVFYNIFNKDYATCGTVSIDNAKLGDVVVFDFDKSSYSEDHYAIYLYTSESNVYVYDANSDYYSKVVYGSSYAKSAVVKVFRASNYDAVNNSSTPSINYVTGLAGQYYLQNKNTGYWLAVSEGKDASTQPINTWANWGTDFRVKLTASGNGYKINFPNVSSLLVNSYSDTPTSGTKINLYKDVNNSSQWWGFEKVGDAYAIRCLYNPSLVLTSNGTSQATLTTYTGAANQLWYLHPYTSTVTYNANGGSGAPSSQTKYFNETLTLSSTRPTRSGYTFLGWSTSSTATSATYSAGGSFTTNASTTLYAVWRSQNIEICVDGNSDNQYWTLTLDDFENINCYLTLNEYYGNSITYSYSTNNSNVSCSIGNTNSSNQTPFSVYANSIGETTITLSVKDTVTDEVLDNINIYVTVRAKEYTVTYDANGGTGAPEASTHQSGTTHTVSSIIPERFGCSFFGWGTSPDAANVYSPGYEITVTGNIILYAKWIGAFWLSDWQPNEETAMILAPGCCWYYYMEPSYTRTYHFESTGSVDSKISIYNSSGTELTSNDDSGEGYNFSLDYTFNGGEKYYIKIHAYGNNAGDIPFTVSPYWKIKYDANGGVGAPETQEKLHGQDICLSSAIPQRSGYTFLGWSYGDSTILSPGSTYSYDWDETLYAVWKENVSLITNKWVKDDNGWRYYDANGNIVKNAWKQDSVGWCYLGADGYMVTNQWVKDSVGWCYLDANGRMVCNNWVYDNGKWYFMDTNGYMVSNCWKKDSKGWCYLGSSGAMLTNAWVKDSVGWCYVGADGYCVTNKWVKDSKGWCYLDGNGRMVYNKWVKDSKGWCYVGSNGYMVYNQWVQDGGKWYYIDANGYMVTGTKVINGKTYKFASNGVWIG